MGGGDKDGCRKSNKWAENVKKDRIDGERKKERDAAGLNVGGAAG